ncbi:hypothetical protein [Oscillatoria sp. FACHB-1406]|uniref:hypothetical protein n=1 Tax=Oscillatoria sp. FACHB-1406 TaxID=2692846 RepID=UPI00168572AA|nr:hypothetical protein [Oscillatoria sp. FACHB-1406]MBD2578986.1 hypothetical protein [Oscillatoria sp. FACHB-1406]
MLEQAIEPNSLTDEIDEFFREVAALKGQNVRDTVEEMRVGTQKYLDAVNTPIDYKNELPENIPLYVSKIENIAEGIESCWDIFSPETQTFFILLSHYYYRARESNFKGLSGLTLKLKLLLPSIRVRSDLYHQYRNSFILIPQAVEKSLKLRDKKGTSKLAERAATLSQKIKINLQPNSTLDFEFDFKGEPESIILSPVDWEIVTSALEDSAEPSERLKEAMKKYLQQYNPESA